MKRRALASWLLLLMMGFLATAPRAWAEEAKHKPERGVIAAMAFPGLILGVDDTVRVDLIVKNTGRADETVYLETTQAPEGWTTKIASLGKTVTGVFLAEDQEKVLTFSAEPKPEKTDTKGKLPPGEYTFVVLAKTADGVLTRTTTLKITVRAGEAKDNAVSVNTSYPVLRGPSDTKFEFTLDVRNASEADEIFNLQAKAPDGWEISFKPAYEQKQISSLQIKANQSQSVGVQVTPARKAEAGEYPVTVEVSTPRSRAEVRLSVVLTGTYKLSTGTANGVLSVVTRTGRPAALSLYVRNEGSATQREVSFVSFKPENWKVEFKPEKLEGIKAGEMKQVEMTITPSEEALVGDYSVAVTAQGEKATHDVELRVTVRASTAWGWIGVAVILAVILGLAWTFKRLGRR